MKKVTRWRSLLKRYGAWAVPFVAVGVGAEAINRRPRLKLLLAGAGVCGLVTLWQTQLPQVLSNGYLPRPQMTGVPSKPEESGTYKIVDIGTLGGENANALGISNSGAIVGVSEDAQGRVRGFIWKNGRMKDVGTLGGTFSVTLGVNDKDESVGISLLSGDEKIHGFVTQNGKMRDFGRLGLDFSVASGINNSGIAIGTALTQDGDPKAVLWKDGKLKPAVTLKDFPATVGCAINDSGSLAIIGFNEGENAFGFLVQNGKAQLLPSVSKGGSVFTDAINADSVVGGECFRYVGETFECVATLWKKGRPEALPLLEGYPCTVLDAINAKGDAVGVAYSPTEEDCGEGSRLRLRFSMLKHSLATAEDQSIKMLNLEDAQYLLSLNKSEIPHAFLYRNGKTVDLNKVVSNGAGWIFIEATGINDRGDITVIGIKGRQVRAVVLTPQ